MVPWIVVSVVRVRVQCVMCYGAGPPYIRTFHHHGADRVFSPISPPPRPNFRAYQPDYVLDGPARARPCPRPLKGSSYSFSARCRPASGPKPRSATARPLLGPFLAPAPRGLLSPQPDYVLEPRERRRRPRAVVLGPVVQYLCWWQRILSPINLYSAPILYISQAARGHTSAPL